MEANILGIIAKYFRTVQRNDPVSVDVVSALTGISLTNTASGSAKFMGLLSYWVENRGD